MLQKIRAVITVYIIIPQNKTLFPVLTTYNHGGGKFPNHNFEVRDIMTTIHLDSEIDLEQVIQGMNKLDNIELENVLSRISIMLAKKKAPSLPNQESKLLGTINQSVDRAILQRHTDLTKLMHDDKLTEIAHKELIQLIDQLELADAERLQALVELASIRAVTIDALMQQLNIQAPKPRLVH